MDLERLLVVLPAEENETTSNLRKHYEGARQVAKEWHSANDTKMSRNEIRSYLTEHAVLEPYLRPGGLL